MMVFLFSSANNQFSDSPDTNECSTVQFDSDTNYPEWGQILPRKGLVPQDHPHFRYQPQGLGFAMLLTNQP